MHNNLNTQALKQWSAKLNETAQKIEIEVSDGVTYVG